MSRYEDQPNHHTKQFLLEKKPEICPLRIMGFCWCVTTDANKVPPKTTFCLLFRGQSPTKKNQVNCTPIVLRFPIHHSPTNTPSPVIMALCYFYIQIAFEQIMRIISEGTTECIKLHLNSSYIQIAFEQITRRIISKGMTECIKLRLNNASRQLIMI